MLGSIDGRERPLVDAAGLVSPGSDRPSIDWWVAADDRWHVPAREAAVRQSLIRGTPVVETVMRVPGGDVVHRCCVVRLPSSEGGGDAVLIEVENRTGIPFALALALRPFGPSGRVEVYEVSQDGGAIVADGRSALVMAKAPNRVVAGAGNDLLEAVVAGDADETSFEPVDDAGGTAQVVAVVPVPHKTVYRAVIPLDRDRRDFPSVLPSTAEVAEGWRVQMRDAARVKLPDARRTVAFDALPPALLLAAGQADQSARSDQLLLADALDSLGFRAEAGDLLASVLGGIEGPALAGGPDADFDLALALALARHIARGGDEMLAAAGVDVAARAAQRLADGLRPTRFLGKSRAPRQRALQRSSLEVVDDLLSIARLLERAGESIAAGDVESLARRAAAGDHSGEAASALSPQGDEALSARLDALLAEASPTVAWPGTAGWASAAQAAILLVDSLVQVRPGHVALAPEVPLTWLGQNFEAHAFHTAAGVISYAVRWHAERPALLWEVVDAESPLTITAPGLDALWSTGELAGEALLAPRDMPAAVTDKPRGAVIGGLQIGRKPLDGPAS